MRLSEQTEWNDCLCTLNRFIPSKQNNQKCKTILLKRKRSQFNKLFVKTQVSQHSFYWMSIGPINAHRAYSQSILFSTLVEKSISIFCLYGIFLFMRLSPLVALHLTQSAFTSDRVLGHQIATMLPSWSLFYSTKIQFAINQKKTDFYRAQYAAAVILRLLLLHNT